MASALNIHNRACVIVSYRDLALSRYQVSSNFKKETEAVGRFALASQCFENHLGYNYFPDVAPKRVMKGFVSIFFAPVKDGGDFSADKG